MVLVPVEAVVVIVVEDVKIPALEVVNNLAKMVVRLHVLQLVKDHVIRGVKILAIKVVKDHVIRDVKELVRKAVLLVRALVLVTAGGLVLDHVLV